MRSTAHQDVAAAGIDPVLHYLRFGAAEGRNPSPSFRTAYYLDQNRDVAAAGINPLLHYIGVGAAEGRQINPLGSLAPASQQESSTSPAEGPEIVFVSGLPGTPGEEYRVLNPLGVLREAHRTQLLAVDEIGYHAWRIRPRREWAYAQAHPTSQRRAGERPFWRHRYNWHRPNGGINLQTPISRLGLPRTTY